MMEILWFFTFQGRAMNFFGKEEIKFNGKKEACLTLPKESRKLRKGASWRIIGF